MWADMFPIELLSIQSTATRLTCPPCWWPSQWSALQTALRSGMAFKDKWLSLGATTADTQESKEDEEMCVSTCLTLGEEFKRSVSATVPSKCTVKSLMADKKLLSWPQTGYDSVIIQTLSGQTGRNMFFFYQLEDIKTGIQRSVSLVAEGKWKGRSWVSALLPVFWHIVLNTISSDMHDILKHVSSCLRKRIWADLQTIPLRVLFSFLLCH